MSRVVGKAHARDHGMGAGESRKVGRRVRSKHVRAGLHLDNVARRVGLPESVEVLGSIHAGLYKHGSRSTNIGKVGHDRARLVGTGEGVGEDGLESNRVGVLCSEVRVEKTVRHVNVMRSFGGCPGWSLRRRGRYRESLTAARR